MDPKHQGYWIGEFTDGEIVVFAPELQRPDEKDWVYLWSNTTGKVDRYVKHMARKAIRISRGASTSSALLTAFVEQRRIENETSKTDFAERAVVATEREAQREAELAATHRKRLETLGFPWRGLTKTAQRRRITHCWSCKCHLDNLTDVECNSCKWILCCCGACGCGRVPRSLP